MAELRRALSATATPERMRDLGEALYQRARNGDMAAVKLWLQYVAGRPPESVDPDALDLHEYRLLESMPTFGELFRGFAEGVEPAVAAYALQLGLAVNGKRMLGKAPKGTADRMEAILDKQGPDFVAHVAEVQRRRTRRGPDR